MINIRRLESPYIVVKLLTALKGFYTFKELEDKLGLSFHILWRYVSLRSLPEEKTAKMILQRVEEYNPIGSIVSRVIRVNSFGYVETWRYLYNVNFLEIIGYETSKFIGEAKVDIVVVFPEEDMPLALVISSWLGSRVCVVKTRASLDLGRYRQAQYTSRDK